MSYINIRSTLLVTRKVSIKSSLLIIEVAFVYIQRSFESVGLREDVWVRLGSIGRLSCCRGT